MLLRPFTLWVDGNDVLDEHIQTCQSSNTYSKNSSRIVTLLLVVYSATAHVKYQNNRGLLQLSVLPSRLQ